MSVWQTHLYRPSASSFSQLFKCSVLACMSTSVIRCKEPSGAEVTWLSHRMDFPQLKQHLLWYSSGCLYVAHWHPCHHENWLTSKEVVFMSFGKYLCFDPNVALPLLCWLSDSLALPSSRHENTLSFIPLIFWDDLEASQLKVTWFQLSASEYADNETLLLYWLLPGDHPGRTDPESNLTGLLYFRLLRRLH